jgi:hypothetical protein
VLLEVNMRYLVKELSYINGGLAQPGAIVDYDPPKGTTVSSNLEPYKGKAPAAADEAAGDGAGNFLIDNGK